MRPEGSVQYPGARVQVVVSKSMQVLGTELGSSTRTV